MRIISVLLALSLLAGCNGKKKRYFKNTQDGRVWYSTSRGNEHGHFTTLDGRLIDLDGSYRAEEIWWDEVPADIQRTAKPKYIP